MTSPLFYRNPNSWEYIYALQSAYRSANWLPDPDFALSRDPQVWEKVRRDPVIVHAVEQRLHQAAGVETIHQPYSDGIEHERAARITERLFDRLEGLERAKYQLAKGVVVSRAYLFPEGRRFPVQVEPGGPVLNWWMPTKLKEIDRRRVRQFPEWIDVETGDCKRPGSLYRPAPAGGRSRRLRVNIEVYSLQQEKWVRLPNMLQLVSLVYDNEEARLGYGRGLLEAIYQYHRMKMLAVREGMAGIERYAQGIAVAKVSSGALGPATATASKVRDDMLKVVSRMRARHTIVMDKEDEIDVIHPTGAGNRMALDFIEYCDEAITRLILGATLPTGGKSETGSYARAEVEQDSTETLIQFDRKMIDDSLTRDLMGLVWKLNRSNFIKLGLATARMPRLRSVQKARQDPEKEAGIVATLLAIPGFQLKADEVYERIGYSKPTEGDDVLTGSQASDPLASLGGPDNFDPIPGVEPDEPSELLRSRAPGTGRARSATDELFAAEAAAAHQLVGA